MFRLDNFLEAWAQKYRPLSHDPDAKSKHRTFYRIDRLGDSNEFVRNFNTASSPCMTIELRGLRNIPRGKILRATGHSSELAFNRYICYDDDN